MLYFSDVPGRRREQAVLKTTLKAPHSYVVTTSEAVNAGVQSFEMLRVLSWRSTEVKVTKHFLGGSYHPSRTRTN